MTVSRCHRKTITGLLAGLSIVSFAPSGCATSTASRASTPTLAAQTELTDCPSTPAATPISGTSLDQCDEEAFGIEVVGLRSVAAGYLLDFRYRVTDAEKAATFMDRTQKPVLIDQDTGARTYVPSPPKIGSLRQKSHTPIVGRNYFVLFANPGRFIETGKMVTIAMGDQRIEDVLVE